MEFQEAIKPLEQEREQCLKNSDSVTRSKEKLYYKAREEAISDTLKLLNEVEIEVEND